MDIPQRFNLHGHAIFVNMVDNLLFETNHYGEAKYEANIIHLQTSNRGCTISQTQLEETFLHEMTHHILHRLPSKYSKLRDDEDFVTMFSQLLHQALTTFDGKS